MQDKPVVLGRINGLFGTAGWVKVWSHTRPVDNLLRYERWFLGNGDEGRQEAWRLFRVVDAKPHGKTLIAQLADDSGGVVSDRNGAATLLDLDIAVARRDLPELAPGQYYWHDLIGLEVVNTDCVSFGHVSSMMETGGNDVLVVDGDRQRLIPFVTPTIVERVDLDNGRMTVAWEADF